MDACWISLPIHPRISIDVISAEIADN